MRLTLSLAAHRPAGQNPIHRALFAWFIFAYGRIVYNLLGIRAQESFVQSWLVALGLDNATQWKEIAKEAWKGGLFIIIMDRLWMQSNTNWCARRLLAGCCNSRPAGRPALVRVKRYM
jgi:hypothetical protein